MTGCDSGFGHDIALQLDKLVKKKCYSLTSLYLKEMWYAAIHMRIFVTIYFCHLALDLQLATPPFSDYFMCFVLITYFRSDIKQFDTENASMYIQTQGDFLLGLQGVRRMSSGRCRRPGRQGPEGKGV